MAKRGPKAPPPVRWWVDLWWTQMHYHRDRAQRVPDSRRYERARAEVCKTELLKWLAIRRDEASKTPTPTA